MQRNQIDVLSSRVTSTVVTIFDSVERARNELLNPNFSDDNELIFQNFLHHNRNLVALRSSRIGETRFTTAGSSKR